MIPVRVVAAVLASVALGAMLFGLAPAADPRWSADAPIAVWIESLNVPAQQIEMVRRALRTWEQASAGALRFEEVREFPSHGIRLRFVIGDSTFGEAAPSIDRAGRIFRAEVVLSVDAPGDALQKQLVLYLTALHELGHALGLAHTDDFDTIMYRFRRPLDPELYFRRYRSRLRSADDIGSERARGLHPADLAALRRLYGS